MKERRIAGDFKKSPLFYKAFSVIGLRIALKNSGDGVFTDLTVIISRYLVVTEEMPQSMKDAAVGDVVGDMANGIAESTSLGNFNVIAGRTEEGLRWANENRTKKIVTYQCKIPFCSISAAYFLSSQLAGTNFADQRELIADISGRPMQIVAVSGNF
ncbi:MAG: hypothetical protein LBI39_00255 [Puniceicoccales bacterium]|nr:hypothetical protein [Puniceicoccales bacterium]